MSYRFQRLQLYTIIRHAFEISKSSHDNKEKLAALELRKCTKTFQDQVTQLQASIDEVDIPESDLRKYRIQSQPF